MSFEPLNQDGMNNYYDSTWQAQESLGEYTAKTYLWMFLGLLLTFGIGFSGYASGLVLYAFQTPFAIPVLTGLELITVLVLSMKITTLSIGMARFLFLFYSALNGIVFSIYFLIVSMGAPPAVSRQKLWLQNVSSHSFFLICGNSFFRRRLLALLYAFMNRLSSLFGCPRNMMCT